jgi:hypothetical protein
VAPTNRSRLRLSKDAQEALGFLGGLAGMGYLAVSRYESPIFVAAFLVMMGISVGSGFDRRARERRAREEPDA